MRIVECTQNKVLGSILKPAEDTPTANWYLPQIKQLLEWILTQDQHARLTLAQVQAKVNVLLQRNHHQNDIHASCTFGSSVDLDMDIEIQVTIDFATKSALTLCRVDMQQWLNVPTHSP
jgi:hypothetical protein